MRVAVDGIYFGLLKNLSAEELIELAVTTGADGLNWPFNENYLWDEPGKVAAMLKEAGLSALTVGLTKHLTATPGAEAELREAFAQCVEMAKALGTPIIDCWPRRPEGVTKQQAQEVLTDNLHAILPVAQKAGCVVSFEFEPDTTLERFGEAKEFIAPFGASVKLTADTYHIIRIGDSLIEAGATLGQAIGVIHFSGSHRGEPGSEGDVCDYAGFLKAAVNAGYSGDVVLQYAPPEEARASLTRGIKLAREVVSTVG